VLIDWFTVIAQLINFLILVVLLQRFLYKPILRVMEERQNRIKASWQDAHVAQEEAEQEAETYRQRQQEMESRRHELMAEAQEKADQERESLMQQIREDVAQKRRDWEKAIAQEQENFAASLRQQIAHQTIVITSRVLRDLAETDLEQQMAKVFLRNLENLAQNERQELLRSLQHTSQDIVIWSSFELSEQIRQNIQDLLKKWDILDDKSIQFKTSSEFICGISIQSAQYEMSWSIQDYLDSLEQQVNQKLQSVSSSENG
jgi:F-type H+-transporting ATPase subunit b